MGGGTRPSRSTRHHVLDAEGAIARGLELCEFYTRHTTLSEAISSGILSQTNTRPSQARSKGQGPINASLHIIQNPERPDNMFAETHSQDENLERRPPVEQDQNEQRRSSFLQ